MAGGPIFPRSVVPVTPTKVFPKVFVPAVGGNSDHERGLGVIASLGVNAVWRLRFDMPPTFPEGQLKIRLLALSTGTGLVEVAPSWKSIAPGESPSNVALASEGKVADETESGAGSATTLEWTATEADKYLEAKWDMDVNGANEPKALETVVMDLLFYSTSTLNAYSVWFPMLIWEES